MKKYYLHNGSENIGPFDIEGLKEKKITKDTPVWYEGIDDWTTAGNVDELKSILASVPPPIKKEAATQSFTNTVPVIEQKKTNWYRWVGKILLITLIIFISFSVVVSYLENNSTESDYQQSIMTIAETEAAYPTNYLDAGGKYRENFIGDKIKIDGIITNNATVTTYKDVVVQITFYSKTNTEIGTESYTIYEFFPPNSKKDFKLKIKNYSNVKSIGWNVINASVKN